MANSYFTVRVELNNHDDNDYALLHLEMAKILFYRAILASDQKWYDLPTGEYVRVTTNTLDEIQKLILTTLNSFIARKPQNKNGLFKSYEYLLSKSENLGFKLKPNTDLSKRPK